jgi:hypothetical protein
MTTKDDGGPAFPTDNWKVDVDYGGGVIMPTVAAHPGMTLRDWFAGQAMAGMLANPNATSAEGVPRERAVTSAAYLVADAMLEARK